MRKSLYRLIIAISKFKTDVQIFCNGVIKYLIKVMMNPIRMNLRNVQKSGISGASAGPSRGHSSLVFVPKCQPAKEEELHLLKKFLHEEGKLCVLTGAGISTESGIPDYRSKGVGLYATSDKRPVLYKDFVQKDHVRRRYWARNYVGWPRFSSFEPNVTHKALRRLEIEGLVQCVVTQNVDRLHTKAGSRNVIELHGTAYVVVCLGCKEKISRFHFQDTLRRLNPTMVARTREIRPDGDVELTQEQVDDFVIPSCENCGGILKPDIVFFGDNVPRTIVESVRENVDRADALLVLGSSITTFSGYRIILQAAEAKKPIAVVNIGESRADKHAVFKVSSRCGEVLSKLFAKHDETRKN